MADTESKAQQNQEATPQEASEASIVDDGLRPFYFPDANRSIRAKDYSTAKANLKRQLKREADNGSDEGGDK